MSNETPAREELPDVLTIEQVAQLLQISRTHAYELAHRADFPSFRLGRCLRASRILLFAWIERQSGGVNGKRG